MVYLLAALKGIVFLLLVCLRVREAQLILDKGPWRTLGLNVLGSEVGERKTSPPESTSQRTQTAHDNVPTHLCLMQSKLQQTKHINTAVLWSQNAREEDSRG